MIHNETRHRLAACSFAAGTVLALAPLAPSQCTLVADLTAGNVNNNNASYLTSFFGRQLFWSQVLPASGTELWRWDPATGAQMVVDLAPGSANSGPQQLTPAMLPAGPRLIYSGFEIGHGRELYISDGTAAGTGRLQELRPGSSGSLPTKFVAVRERVFFQANDGSHGDELYVTDGTAAGTQMVRDIWAGAGNGRPDQMTALNGRLLFLADEPTAGEELWISDGTAAGTTLLKDIRPGPSDCNGYQFTRVGDHVYFAASDGVNGNAIWRTDGTAAGTVQVTSLGFNPVIDNLCACGDRLFFTVSTVVVAGTYVTDGVTTTLLTSRVGDHLTCSGEQVFFSCYTASTGNEPWVTDGTAAGTGMIADLDPSTASNPQKFVDVGTGVVFTARVATTGELWFSDGTAAGTFHVCTPDPGGNSGAHELVMCHGHLFFQAYDPAFGHEMLYMPTPGASTADLGGASRPDHPRVWIDGGAVPVLGSAIDVHARGPANHAGVLLAGDARLPLPVPIAPGLIEGGYDAVGLQLGTALTLDIAITPTMTWSFQVPVTTSLEGFGLHFQSLWFGSGAPTLQLSNAIAATLGAGMPH